MELTAAQLGLFGIGILVGAYGTLIGAGGGFVLVPILLFLYPSATPETITAISLTTVFANATSGSIAYARMRRVDFVSGGIFALATVPGAIAGVLTTAHMPRHLFDGILGVLMLGACGFLLVHPTCGPDAGATNRRHRLTRQMVEADGTPHSFSYNPATGITLSVFVGYLSSLLGIGGGIIHVPALTHLLHFPVHIATATSHFVLAVMALVGSLVHLVRGDITNVLGQVIPLALGVVVGAQVGARLSTRLHGRWIVRGLGVALGLVGVRLVWTVMN